MNIQVSRQYFIFLVIAIFSFHYARTQSVGVGTISPDPYAILDVVVPDTSGNPQGLILPRVWKANRTAMTVGLGVAQTGLIVYDLNDSCVYTWKGSSWEGCGDSGPITTSTAWDLGGNNVVSGDFIGTNNAEDLVFQSNGSEVGRLMTNSSVRFGTGVTGTGIGSIAIGTNITANGNKAVGIGNYVNASHLGSFVIGDWSGSAPAVTSSSTSDQFTSRFQGGHRFYNDALLTTNLGVFFEGGTGNVGIGSSNPAEKLDVEGSVQIDGDYTYESAKIDYYSLSAADFVPTFNNADRYSDGNGTGNAKWFENGAPGSAGYFYAGIHVPNGAVISNVEFFHRDTDPGGELAVTLRRFDLAANNLQTLGTGSTGVAFDAGLGSINIPVTHTADNSRYSYYLVVESDQDNANLWLRGAIIQYSVMKAD